MSELNLVNFILFCVVDTSVGRDSPDVWNTPSPYSEPSEEKISKLVFDAPSGHTDESGNSDLNPEKVEIVNSVQEHDDEDSPEVIRELASIPHEPVFQSCNVELEKRTSPEGADAESCCSPEEIFHKSSESVQDDKLAPSPVLTATDEDFGDFADFSSNQLTETKQTNDDDDFDDFEFAAAPVKTPTTEDEDLGQKLSAIFETSDDICLPSEDPQLTGCLHSCLDDSSSVWGHLKDLETSNALALQWTSSSASRKLLSSLNVDSRNIVSFVLELSCFW